MRLRGPLPLTRLAARGAPTPSHQGTRTPPARPHTTCSTHLLGDNALQHALGHGCRRVEQAGARRRVEQVGRAVGWRRRQERAPAPLAAAAPLGCPGERVGAGQDAGSLTAIPPLTALHCPASLTAGPAHPSRPAHLSGHPDPARRQPSASPAPATAPRGCSSTRAAGAQGGVSGGWCSQRAGEGLHTTTAANAAAPRWHAVPGACAALA